MSVHVARLARIGSWLASADPDPDHAYAWWSAQRVALLPLGHRWDAVKTCSERGELAIERGVTGPVITDPGGRCYYFLVPPGTTAKWAPLEGAECLGVACYLTIPSPDRTAGAGVHWRVLPNGRGTLVQPEALRAGLGPLAVTS